MRRWVCWLVALVLGLVCWGALRARYGSELLTEVPEILLIATKPAKIDLPYTIEGVPRVDVLEIGNLKRDFTFTTVFLIGLGLALGGAVWCHVRQGGVAALRWWGRLMVGAGAVAVFLAGMFMLQAALRSVGSLEVLGQRELGNPIAVARTTPLPLLDRSWLCFFLALIFLTLVTPLGYLGRKDWLHHENWKMTAVVWMSLLSGALLFAPAFHAAVQSFQIDSSIQELTSDTLNGQTEGGVPLGRKLAFALKSLMCAGVATQAAGVLLFITALIFPRRVSGA